MVCTGVCLECINKVALIVNYERHIKYHYKDN